MISENTKTLSKGLHNGKRDRFFRPAGTEPTDRDLPVPNLPLAEHWHAMTGSARMIQKSMFITPHYLYPILGQQCQHRARAKIFF
jgi:hypothetical protein